MDVDRPIGRDGVHAPLDAATLLGDVDVARVPSHEADGGIVEFVIDGVFDRERLGTVLDQQVEGHIDVRTEAAVKVVDRLVVRHTTLGRAYVERKPGEVEVARAEVLDEEIL